MRFLVAVVSLMLVVDAAQAQKRRAVRSPGAAAVFVARTVVLAPAKDNTLYRFNDGSRSNGRGVHLFAGLTASREPRRALLAFDLAPQIPAGSVVTRVVLTMQVTRTVSGTSSMSLHRVAADWGEGVSDAGFVRDGIGNVSQLGDATWLHTFFPNQRWISEGGDFDALADATAVASSGAVSWESAAMIARVQQWVDQPSANFGWIVIGDETRTTTAKQLDSREAGEETRPLLRVEFNARQ